MINKNKNVRVLQFTPKSIYHIDNASTYKNINAHSHELTITDMHDAISHIPFFRDHKEWFTVASVIKTALGDAGRESWISYNAGQGKPQSEITATWRGIKEGKHGTGTLIYLAKQGGWTPPHSNKKLSNDDLAKLKADRDHQAAVQRQKQLVADAKRKAQFNADRDVILSLLHPIFNPSNHPYLLNKNLSGANAYSVDLSRLDADFKARNNLLNVSDNPLFIKIYNTRGEVVGIQHTTTTKKRPITGSTLGGGVFGLVNGEISSLSSYSKFVLGEGYATVASFIAYDPSYVGIVAISAHNISNVCGSIRAINPNADLTLLADNDESRTGQDACKVASDKYRAHVLTPYTTGQDFSDVWVKGGRSAIDHIVSTQHNLTININEQYISDAVSNAIDSKTTKTLVVKSDMGTGKTYALAELSKRSNVLVVSPLVGTLTSTKTALESLGINAMTYQERGYTSADIIFTTFNSLPIVRKAIQDAGEFVGALVIDESELSAVFLANGTIDNKHDASVALQALYHQVNHVVINDAHYSINSDAFLLNKFGVSEYTTMDNAYLRWQGKNYSFDDSDEAKNNARARVLEMTKGNQPFVVGATSQTELTKLYGLCKDALPHKEMLLVTADTCGITTLTSSDGAVTKIPTAALQAKIDTGLFNNYDIVFYSPTMGVGTSVDKCPKFKHGLFILSNHDKTGDSLSALQLCFRFRDLEHFECFYVDTLNKSKATARLDIVASANSIMSDITAYLADQKDSKANQLLLSVKQDYLHYEATIEAETLRDKLDFGNRFVTKLNKKGMIRTEVTIQFASSLQADMTAKAHELAEIKRDNVLTAVSSDKDKLKKLRAKQKSNDADLSIEDRYILAKASIQDNLLVRDKREDIPSLEQAYNDAEKGTIKHIRNIQQDTLSGDQIKVIATAGLLGTKSKKHADFASNYYERMIPDAIVWGKVLQILGVTLTSNNKGSLDNLDASLPDSALHPTYKHNDKLLLDNKELSGLHKDTNFIKAINATNKLDKDTQLDIKLLKTHPALFVKKIAESRYGMRFKSVPVVEGWALEGGRQRIKTKKDKQLIEFINSLGILDGRNRAPHCAVLLKTLQITPEMVAAFNDGRRKDKITPKQLKNTETLLKRLFKLAGMKVLNLKLSPNFKLKEASAFNYIKTSVNNGKLGAYGRYHDIVYNMLDKDYAALKYFYAHPDNAALIKSIQGLGNVNKTISNDSNLIKLSEATQPKIESVLDDLNSGYDMYEGDMMTEAEFDALRLN